MIKHFLIISFFLGFCTLLQAQSNTIRFSYDDSGNRICKYTVSCMVINDDDPLTEGLSAMEVDSILHLEDALWTPNELQTEEMKISYFPNPTHDIVHFEWTGKDEVFQGQVFASDGKLLRSFLVEDSSYQLNLQTYPSGNYLVWIHNNDTHQVYRINKY